jgi:transposase
VILVGKPEGKRPLGRPRRRWVDNIIVDLREKGWDGMHWIDLAQERGPVEGSCENGNELSGSIKWWEVLE